MPAGLNLHVKFIRLVSTDDDVGGAYVTGTVLHNNVAGRIDSIQPNTDFLQQGLETIRIFSAMFWPDTLTFREQDEVEVISPPNHPYYGKRFRVMSVQYDSNHPAQRRGYIIATLARSQISHGENYQ